MAASTDLCHFYIFKGNCRDSTMSIDFRPGIKAARLHDLGDLFFPLDGHDMEPSNAFQLFEPLDGLYADLDAFFRLFFFCHANWP